jgi:oxalate decarboxylase/phosphoglucose isomerase-like protein (cupin superfamily)
MKNLIFFLCAIIVVSAQHESEAKRRSKLNAADFVFDLAKSQPDAQAAGGVFRTATLDNFPALSGEGLSQRLFSIKPCGINVPHSHPRASELLYAIDAEDLQVGFAEENGGRVIVNRISTGFSTVVPRGLIHYQINLSCKNATYLVAYSSEDPGFVTVMAQTFLFPNYVLSGTLGIAEIEVDKLRNGLQASPSVSFQQSECYQRCGLKRDEPQNSVGLFRHQVECKPNMSKCKDKNDCCSKSCQNDVCTEVCFCPWAHSCNFDDGSFCYQICCVGRRAVLKGRPFS